MYSLLLNSPSEVRSAVDGDTEESNHTAAYTTIKELTFDKHKEKVKINKVQDKRQNTKTRK